MELEQLHFFTAPFLKIQKNLRTIILQKKSGKTGYW